MFVSCLIGICTVSFELHVPFTLPVLLAIICIYGFIVDLLLGQYDRTIKKNKLIVLHRWDNLSSSVIADQCEKDNINVKNMNF